MSTLPVATVVEILPTRIWIESDMMGSRHVVLQHQGFEPFTYASFFYDYAYTSNGGTWAWTRAVASVETPISPASTARVRRAPSQRSDT